MRLVCRLGIGVLVIASATPLATVAETPGGRSTEALVFTCFTCHGPEGRSSGEIEGLQGQSARRIRRKLEAFREGRDRPTIMDRIAKGYTDDEIARIAAYIGKLE